MTERRRHNRFKPREGTFAALKGHLGKIGQINDISKGGLSMTYVDIGKRPNGCTQLDILLSEYGFHLKDLPIRSISDIELKKTLPFSSLVMRRRGIEFEALDDRQISFLDYFLKYHIVSDNDLPLV